MDGGAWWAAVHGVAKSQDRTERLHFHFSLSCIGEGNGSPLQCSCLENPRDGGAWWAAVYGVHGVGHDWSHLAAAVSSHLQTGTVFTSSFPIWAPCISFSFLFYVARASKTMLKRSGENWPSCLAPDLRRDIFSFSPLRYGFVIYGPYLRYVPCGLSGGSAEKILPASAGDMGLIFGLGRSPGEGNDNPFHYSCWEIPWTKEPGGLPVMGSQRIRCYLATKQ